MNQEHWNNPAGANLKLLLGVCQMDPNTLQMLKVTLTVGPLLGSAVASPILFETRNVWLFAMLVFLISSAAFMLQNLEEIITWSPVTLVVAALLGLAAYGSARTPLRDLTPWLPIAIVLLLLLTAFALPKLRRAPHRLEDSLEHSLDSMEQGRSNSPQGSPTDPSPASVRSGWSIPPGNGSLEMDRWLLDHNVSNMDHRPPSRISQRPSVHGSDIDLDAQLPSTYITVHRVVGLVQGGHLSGRLSQASSDLPQPQAHTASESSHPFRQLGSFHSRSPSPGSVAVNNPSSASADSECQLLG